jgi:hypothetical protein
MDSSPLQPRLFAAWTEPRDGQPVETVSDRDSVRNKIATAKVVGSIYMAHPEELSTSTYTR